MFNKLKQFKDLRGQAKDMQSKLAEESTTATANNVSLVMDGNLTLKSLDIPADLLSVDKKSKLEAAIVAAHASALKTMQRTMAMKMKEMGGLPDIPGLS